VDILRKRLGLPFSPHKLFAGLAEEAAIDVVDEGQGAVGQKSADYLGLVLHHGPVTFFACPQRLFHSFAFGDVAHDSPDAGRGAGTVAMQAGPQLHREDFTVTASVFFFVDIRKSPDKNLVPDDVGLRLVPFFRSKVTVGHAEKFSPVIAEHGAEEIVAHQDPSVHVYTGEGIHHCGMEVPQYIFRDAHNVSLSRAGMLIPGGVMFRSA